MAKILLLGDSIRMSYQPLVAASLAGSAEVVGPAENCQFSLFTLANLERWLHDLGKPDLVHWNNGLHDVGHNPDRRPLQVPLDIYRMTLGFILERLKRTGAKVLWATTTPVHPARPFRQSEWSWRIHEIEAYNREALSLMGEQDVIVNDLHAVVAADPDAMLQADQLHLSEAGMTRCAEAVADAVGPHLA